jgi:hypothetical protein
MLNEEPVAGGRDLRLLLIGLLRQQLRRRNAVERGEPTEARKRQVCHSALDHAEKAV